MRGGEVGARGFHHRANGAFGHTVELVCVWRTRGVRHQGFIHEFFEIARQELTCVVGVQGANNVRDIAGRAAEHGVESGDGGAYSGERFAFGLETVDKFEARVVIDQHQGVLKTIDEVKPPVTPK